MENIGTILINISDIIVFWQCLLQLLIKSYVFWILTRWKSVNIFSLFELFPTKTWNFSLIFYDLPPSIFEPGPKFSRFLVWKASHTESNFSVSNGGWLFKKICLPYIYVCHLIVVSSQSVLNLAFREQLALEPVKIKQWFLFCAWFS